MLQPMRRACLLLVCLSGCSIDSGGTADDISLGVDSAIEDAFVSTDEGLAVDSNEPDTTIDMDTGVVASDTAIDTAPIDTGVVVDTAPETPVVVASLVGTSGQLSALELNLSTEGTLDWAHWGQGGDTNAWNRKSGGTALTKGPIGSPSPWGAFPTKVSWTSGTPTATVKDSTYGIYHDNKNDNFAFDAAGDPATERTLRVYATWNGCTGTIDAKLAEAGLTWSGSLPPSGGTGSGIQAAWYQLKFRTTTGTDKIQIKLTQTSGGGYMGIIAATLQ